MQRIGHRRQNIEIKLVIKTKCLFSIVKGITNIVVKNLLL